MIAHYWNRRCVFSLEEGAALLSSVCADSVQGPNQRRLLQDLLRDYNRLTRPVVNDSHTLPVELNLSLMQIIDLVGR